MMLLRLIAIAFVLTAPALAQRTGGGGIPDPFVIPQFAASPYGEPNRVTAGLTPRATQTLSPAVRNVVLIAAGQSENSNVAPNVYSPVNASALDSFNIYDGALYPAVDPLLGAVRVVTGGSSMLGHPALRLADVLVQTGKADRVVIAAIGVGSTLAADWATGFLKDRVSITLRRLAARGIVEGTNVTIVILWGQGLQDANAGTSQGAYQTSLGTLIASSRAVGFTGRWFIAKQTYNGTAVNATIQAAQAALIDHPNGIWLGADADSLVGSVCSATPCRQADNIHWSNNGSASYATSWNTGLIASGAPFNFLLRRDLGGAVNDNRPVFVDIAA